MDRESCLEDTRIDLENPVEEQRISLLEHHGVCLSNVPGITEEEQTRSQSEENSIHDEMKVHVKGRDPKGVNKCLKVSFEDTIGEPVSVHSFDKVWLWSHVLFEVSRLWSYRLISLLLAVPVAMAAGLLFAILSCLHIWLIVPCAQLLLINMHWVKLVWGSMLDLTLTPFFNSLGRCYGAISIRWAKN